MTGITEQLAGFVAGLDYDKIPAEVAERAKLLILDTVGISVRARHDAESTEAMMQAIEALELDGGERFVKPGTPWMHLDIAGTALVKADTANGPKGATGWGVLSLDRMIRDRYER